jgi:hypothetical protein
MRGEREQTNNWQPTLRPNVHLGSKGDIRPPGAGLLYPQERTSDELPPNLLHGQRHWFTPACPFLFALLPSCGNKDRNRGAGISTEGVAMDEAIARENIKHFRKLLETETDEAKRKTLLTLLSEEEGKLAKSIQRKKKW